jgi:hypothetical protein
VLHEIGSDKPRYEAMLAWKQTKVGGANPWLLGCLRVCRQMR